MDVNIYDFAALCTHLDDNTLYSFPSIKVMRKGDVVGIQKFYCENEVGYTVMVKIRDGKLIGTMTLCEGGLLDNRIGFCNFMES